MIDKLRLSYDQALQSNEMSLKLAFVKMLVECKTEECVDYHIAFLKQQDTHFINMINYALRKRGDAIVPKLIVYARDDHDPDMQAGAIRSLGNLRSRASIPIITEKMRSRHRAVRYACIIALGWLGSIEDAGVLAEHYKAEDDALLRGYCVTAIRQIYLQHQDSKEFLLSMIGQTFMSEQDADAKKCIILSSQTIASKNFGLRESTKTGKVTGDVSKSWQALVNFFAAA